MPATPSTAAPDRAPDWVAAGAPEPLRSGLEAVLGSDRVLGRATDLVRYASDASPYRLFPRAVVAPRDADDVAKVLAYGREQGVPVTFRAAGTSLNGQAQGQGILVDARRHFGGLSVEDGGKTARVRPGTVLGHVNRALAPRLRKLGPDPASTAIATVGGVIANNSGGMRCGVTRDSYSTLRALTFVLPSGTRIDTAAAGAEAEFEAREPSLAAGLGRIRDEIRADPDLSGRIRRKYAIKNTMGYRLCAFLDADSPLEIFRRLLVGSEGTLGFVAEAVFDTVPLPRATTTAWVHFADVAAAVEPVPDLVAAGASAVELMMAPALAVASHNIPGAPAEWKELPPESAVLLVEFGADEESGLADAEARALDLLAAREPIRPIDFTRDGERIELNWRVREGLHGLIGKLRPEGTALIVEDVCVPPDRVAEGVRDVRDLLAEHGFLPGVAGHASAGNLHFMLTPDFSRREDVRRYEAFMSGLVDLVVERYDGSLKAEHGTGVNMAPYVEREWGPEATSLMWRVKELADPDGVLSPGVLLNRDPEVHLRNLKTTPPIEPEATACVECGFCEPVCPSRDLTTTPRQRIVLRREMARQPEESAVRRALEDEYEYDGLETCAADGSCRLACPLGIDTGALVKRLRAAGHGPRAERAAVSVARRWGAAELAARMGLRLRCVLRRISPGRAAGLPPPAPPLPSTSREGAAAVYFPACINRIFGPSEDAGRSRGLPATLVEVSARAGLPLWIPHDVAGRCCATPWESKGYRRGAEAKSAEMAARVAAWTDGGRLPLVVDAASCTQAVAARAEGTEILDSVQWAERLLPWLEVTRRRRRAAIHPTCSTRHLGLEAALARLAAGLAEEVHVSAGATCCGFAGDRGFLRPELTAAATKEEAGEVRCLGADAHLSHNRTCEVGLERATGRPYESVIFLLEELTRPA